MDDIQILLFNWQDRQHPLAGGAETHLHAIFGRLAARGYGVTLVSSSWPGADSLTFIDGIEVHRVGSRATYAVAAPAHYRRVLRHRHFDLVVEDLNKVPLATPLWVREPVVLLVHHLFGSSALSAASVPVALATMALERLLLPAYRGSTIVAVSESSAREARRVTRHRERVPVVHNGADSPSSMDPAPASEMKREPTLLVLGRLQRYKRVDLPIRALALLQQADSGIRLLIAGEGPDERRLRTLATRLGVTDRVTFLGRIGEPEKASLLGSVTACVNTSVKEGWGISILEAAARGTPTIASDSPGLRDAVRDEQTGLLVPHGDVNALAAAMRRLVGDAPLAARLGAAARSFARTFTWDHSADAFDLILREAHRAGFGAIAPAPALDRSPAAVMSARRTGIE